VDWGIATYFCDQLPSHVALRPSGELSVAFGPDAYYPGWESFARYDASDGTRLLNFPSQTGPDTFPPVPDWSAGVGDVTGSGVEADLIPWLWGQLRLLEVGAIVVDPDDPPLIDDYLTPVAISAGFGLFCGDVSGDGLTDLCTDVGIDRHPVDGVFETSWTPTEETLLSADLDGDGTQELYRYGSDVVRIDGQQTGVLDLSAAPSLPGPFTAGAVGDWSGDGIDDLVLLGSSGLERITVGPTGAMVSTPMLPNLNVDGVLELALGQLDPTANTFQLIVATHTDVRVVDPLGVVRAHWTLPGGYAEFGHGLHVDEATPDRLFIVAEDCGSTMVLAVTQGI
jgi:hypothetical protein